MRVVCRRATLSIGAAGICGPSNLILHGSGSLTQPCCRSSAIPLTTGGLIRGQAAGFSLNHTLPSSHQHVNIVPTPTAAKSHCVLGPGVEGIGTISVRSMVTRTVLDGHGRPTELLRGTTATFSDQRAHMRPSAPDGGRTRDMRRGRNSG